MHVDALKESENTLTTACNDNFWLLLSSNVVVSCSHRVFSVCSQYFKVSALLYRQLASLYFSNFPSPRSGPLAPRTTPKACHLSFFLLALLRSNDRQEARETVQPHSRSIPGFLLDLPVSSYSCLCGCIVRACRRVAFDSGTVHCFHVRNKFCMDQVSLMLRVLFCIDSSLIGLVWKPSEVASNLFWMFVPIFAVLHCFFRA